MTHLARVAALLFNRPLAVLPETATIIASNLADRLGVEPMREQTQPPAEASAFRGSPVETRLDNGSKRVLYRMQDGVAIVPVQGELVNRGAWIGASSGLTSYEGFAEQLRAAVNDQSVRAILLDIDSPGGEASGAMEAGALVRQAAAQKPVVALVNSLAASAGYAIASGAGRIMIPPSGEVGSIGVIMLHVDQSAAIERAGVKPTLILSDDADYKADHSPLAPLSEGQIGRLKASVNALQDLFVATVASHRAMPEKAVRATKGALFMGAQAVETGLADQIGGFDEAMAWLKTQVPQNTILTGANMTTANPDAAAVAAATNSARAEARAAERARAQAILNAPEAEGRGVLANYLAFETEMEPQAALAVLAKAPAMATLGQAGDPPAPLAARASRLDGLVPRPDVQPDTPPAPAAKVTWDDVVADVNRMGALSSRSFVAG